MASRGNPFFDFRLEKHDSVLLPERPGEIQNRPCTFGTRFREILQRFVYLYTHCEIDERIVPPIFSCVKMKKSIFAIA